MFIPYHFDGFHAVVINVNVVGTMLIKLWKEDRWRFAGRKGSTDIVNVTSVYKSSKDTSV